MSRYRTTQGIPKRLASQAPNRLEIQITQQVKCALNGRDIFDIEMLNGSCRAHNKKFVKLMKEVKKEIKNSSIKLDKEIFNSVMERLRRYGRSAYSSLGHNMRHNLNQNIQEKELRGVVDIPVITNCYPLLWEFLYTGSPNTPVDPKLFWGCRHRVTRYFPRTKKTSTPFDPPEDFLFCRNHRLTYTQKEEDKLRSLARTHHLPFVTLEELFKARELAYDEPELYKQFIKVCQEHVFSFLHMACHLKPDPDPNSVLDAWLELSYCDKEINIVLAELNAHFDSSKFGQNPFIFLNACKTMTNPEQLLQTDSFPRAFFEMGASTVIATACDMPDLFAAEFASKFYEFFWGQLLTAGEALRQTRQYFIDEYNNPLGLAYGLYGDSDLRIYW